MFTPKIHKWPQAPIFNNFRIYNALGHAGYPNSMKECYFPMQFMLSIMFHCSCCCLVIKSYPTPCDPMGCSLPGSSVHGILQARILEWDAISFSRGSSWHGDQTSVSCIAVRFFTTESPGKPIMLYYVLLI